MKRQSTYTKYLEWALMLGACLGVLVLSKKSGFMDSLKPDTSTGKYIMVIGMIMITFLALAAHELGHLITGLVQGFRFELFVVGPLGIRREKEGIKVYLNKNLGYYGGVAATLPVNDDKDNAQKFARVLLAGPIASILFAIFCFVLAYFLGKPLGMTFYTGGLISIVLFFATTIPSKTGLFFTDRKRYQRLVYPGKDREVELAMLRILGTFSKDNSYKNIDRNDINILVSDELPFIQFFGLFNLICFQLENDGMVEEEVSEHYDRVSKEMSKNLVLAFNKEIDNLKERLKVVPQ